MRWVRSRTTLLPVDETPTPVLQPAFLGVVGAERLFLAVPDRLDAPLIPAWVSAFFTASARLVPSAKLCSIEPRWSQCPSIVKRMLGYCCRNGGRRATSPAGRPGYHTCHIQRRCLPRSVTKGPPQPET